MKIPVTLVNRPNSHFNVFNLFLEVALCHYYSANAPFVYLLGKSKNHG